MRNREALTRYHLIDARLRQKPRPTFAQLMDYIAEHLGKPVARCTLQRDIENLRNNQALGYSAPIIYDKRRGWYCYEDEDYSLARAIGGKEELKADALLEEIADLIEDDEVESREAIKKIKEIVKTREVKSEKVNEEEFEQK